MKYSILKYIFLLTFFLKGFSQSDQPLFLNKIPLKVHFDTNEYHGGIQSWSFDQDSTGVLYVANNNGLLKFDGRKWSKYEVPSTTRLRAVLIDSQDRIFVGGQGELGYFSMTRNGLVFTSLLEKLEPKDNMIAETWKIIENKNRIFFRTESELLLLEGSNFKSLNLPGHIQREFKLGDRLLFQFYNLGIYELQGDEFSHIDGTSDIPEIISILPKSEGHYYFTRSGQVYEDNRKEVYRKISLSYTIGTINEAIKLSTGEYAIGTQNNGLFILEPDLSIKLHLTKNQGLSDRTVNSLYEDDFHNLWLALNNGIDYLELRLPFSLINEELGVQGTGYAAKKFNDQVYLGTSNGLFTQKSSSEDFSGKGYEIFPGSEGQVYNFSEVGNDLILNHHRGSFKINGSNLIQFDQMGSWKVMGTSIPDLLLEGNYRGITFFNKKKNTFSKLESVPGLNESSRIMEFENDSILWMTHGSKGAFRIVFNNKMKAKKIDHFGVINGFPSNLKISVYSINNKLVFTGENGIYNFNEETQKFEPNKYFNKLLGEEHVSEIASSGKNSIYYIQNAQVGLLKEESFGKFSNEESIFNHINEFVNDDLSNISILDNRNVLIGAKEGFIHFDPQKKFKIREDFKVYLTTFKTGVSAETLSNQIVTLNKNVEIIKKQSVKFEFSSPYFDGFQDLKYSYRIVPLDDKWSEWSPKGEMEYKHLPYGDYTFEVKALNVYGLESDITSLSFEVLTPWYFTNTAISIYMISGLLSLLLIPLIQRRVYNTEKNSLTRSKERALKMKDEQISQITMDSKMKIDKIANEKLKSEVALKNEQLTTTTMQLLDKNEFLQDVRKKIKTSLDNNGSKEVLKGIVKTIDKDLSKNDAWDQFAYHFDQVHGNYLEKLAANNINLSPREMKLAAFLRMNMSSKEIAKLMNISVRGVELARYRLRKKLKLERHQNLVEYLIELDVN